MHELRRLAYLEAMGIECYESRRPLPGAASSRRRPIAARSPVTKPVDALSAPPVLPEITTRAASTEAAAISASVPRARAARGTPANDAPQPSPPHAFSIPRFSLVTVVAGDWLWLEELGEMPLTTEQVQLVQAMAYALQRYRDGAGAAPSAPARADVLRFDWPLHNNRQLDSGEHAARAGATAFISRRLEQSRSQGLVLLGKSCANRVLANNIDIVTVSTASSAEILQTPVLKQRVWQDLLPLLRAS